jgi:pyrroloquinoline quinone (PQQ) biosynthesis protein C
MNFDALYERLREHPAVNHELFTYLENAPYDTRSWSIFLTQHHHVVAAFPSYLRALFLRLSREEQEILGIVLEDELREDGVHEDMQRRMCSDIGATPSEPLEEVTGHIMWHTISMKAKPIPEALGIIGPGHEAIIPVIFRRLVSGAPPMCSPDYLYAHLAQDPVHDARFRAVISQYVVREDLVVQGAMRSLAVRARMWDAILRKIKEEV